MPTAPSQASIKVMKSFVFRGQTRLWSNRYYLNNTSIDTQAHFNTLADAVVLAEKAIYPSWYTITEVLYYAPGSSVAVWTRSYSTVGTHTVAGAATPGEVAALIRYSTTQKTSKNHPLFLFNYYHGCDVQTGSTADLLQSSYSAALTTYANAWVTGFSDGVTTYKRAGPHGAVAQGALVETYATHRDFPR